jgi:hypothetical protein
MKLFGNSVYGQNVTNKEKYNSTTDWNENNISKNVNSVHCENLALLYCYSIDTAFCRIAASPPHRRITSLLHRRATAAQLVLCRTAVPHRRSEPHRRRTAAWAQHRLSLPDRCRIAAAPPHSRSAVCGIAAASQQHHFRTASPRRSTVWPHLWCCAAPQQRTVVPRPGSTTAVPPNYRNSADRCRIDAASLPHYSR